MLYFPAHSLVSERAESDIRREKRRGIGGAIYPVVYCNCRQTSFRDIPDICRVRACTDRYSTKTHSRGVWCGRWKAVDAVGVGGMDLRRETKRSLN